MSEIDSPERFHEVKKVIEAKPSLKHWYETLYSRYAACVARAPREGLVVELGSGAGFAKRRIPELITTDVVAYPEIDRVVDGTSMPFADESVRCFLMLNVLHHVPDAEKFFAEMERCLIPGGRVLIVDQNLGWISTPILKYAHHEPFNAHAKEWRFETSGPLSGANGALAWIIFRRDRARFERLFPKLAIERIEPHSPLGYWLTGGLKKWNLLPGVFIPALSILEKAMLALSKNFGSFVDIELSKSRTGNTRSSE